MEWVVFLRHGRRFIIAGAVLGLLAGLVVGARSRPLYQARTEVLVRPVLVDPFQATATAGRVINMYTERQRAGSAAVAQRARGRMHTSDSLRTIRSHLAVTVTGSTQLLVRLPPLRPREGPGRRPGVRRGLSGSTARNRHRPARRPSGPAPR